MGQLVCLDRERERERGRERERERVGEEEEEDEAQEPGNLDIRAVCSVPGGIVQHSQVLSRALLLPRTR